MITRRSLVSLLAPAVMPGLGPAVMPALAQSYPPETVSSFAKRLKPVGRILETEGWYVWCNSPVYGPDGKVHVFFSRWPDRYGMGGWIGRCEIAHAVAESPESRFEFTGTVLAPRPGCFDSTTCHNPAIRVIDGKYCLFYMGNSDGKTGTKRIGLAIADSPMGPWQRPERPLLEAGEPGAWDDHCTTNPAPLKQPNGEYWLYYKSWNTAEYQNAPPGTKIRGNRKYGLAIAKRLEGPYQRCSGNPVVDFSARGQNRQLEDACVWHEGGRFRMLARDMGFFDHYAGLYLESKDGLRWDLPKVAYYGASHYVNEPPAPKHLSRYGRFERPQLLMKNGRPQYLFTTAQGGRYMTASGFVFRLG